MSSSTFWESIRNQSGWGWALGELSRKPEVACELGPRFKETPLHWAILCHMEATAKFCQESPALLFVQDSQGRSALDWAVEKMFFLRERQEGELPGDKARTAKMIAQTEDCAWFALNWIVAQELPGSWSGDPRRFAQWALAGGQLDLAAKAEEVSGSVVGPEVWLSGLAGLWADKEAVVAYLRSLAARYGIEPDSVVFGRPLGLHVAKLWADGAMASERAIWFHEAGARIDQETREESVELFCAATGDAGARRLELMIKKLGLAE